MGKDKSTIVMVGPDIQGLGGVSRVARVWRESGFFSLHNVTYIGTVSGVGIGNLVCLLRELCVFMSLLMTDCSMVYVHTSTYKSFYRKSLFLFFAWIVKKPSIVHIHPSSFYDFVVESRGLQRQIIFFFLQRAAYLIVLTEEMRCKLAALFPGSAIFVLPNAVDVTAASGFTSATRERRQLLYLGWYVREKGVFDLVDAIRILLDEGFEVHLDFFGTKEVEALRKYVKDRGMSQWITVNGWIGDSEKFVQLARSTALVLPTYSEGIPNVILEAMATKTPIIATKVGGLKEVLRELDNAFIVKVKNPEDLSEKIKMCIQNDAMRSRLAENAYQEVVVKYNVNVIRGKFSQIVKEMEERGKRGKGFPCAEL